jgi:hypothetical protein
LITTTIGLFHRIRSHPPTGSSTEERPHTKTKIFTII